MHFEFGEDPLLLQKTVRDFLEAECTPEWIRGLWETADGGDPGFWTRFAELGVPGLLVPEAHDGLGMDEIDLVLLLEEVGRAGLPLPVVATAAVGAPLVADLGDAGAGPLAAEWLPKLASGAALVAVSHPASPLVADAALADLFLACEPDRVLALPKDAVRPAPQAGNDPSRRLSTLDYDAGDALACVEGATATALTARAYDRGALACAAEALGAADSLIRLAVDYASQRHQFGVPIGSFQAVKHQLADVKVALEYARSLVYRAAHSVARGADTRGVDVSMAKLAACDAASHAAKTALQVHGALGYTWEQDLHIWMRRAWSLDLAWGDRRLHERRLADALFEGAHAVASFGYEAPGA